MLFWCGNKAVDQITKTELSTSLSVMGLWRRLVSCCLRFNIRFKARHVPGLSNGIDDVLPCFQFHGLWTWAPEVRELPDQVPMVLWSLSELRLERPYSFLWHEPLEQHTVGMCRYVWISARNMAGVLLGLGQKRQPCISQCIYSHLAWLLPLYRTDWPQCLGNGRSLAMILPC